MKLSFTLALLCAAATAVPASAQHSHGAAPAARKTAGPTLLTGMGTVHHPVSTRNAEAQRWFDQGLALAYGFNHEEAERSFRRAAELDPKLAMAWWGVALVLGPNINLPLDEARGRKAWEALSKARALVEGASAVEKDYIAALEKRYDEDPETDRATLDRAYADAMRELTRRYPDDLDAATLFAEAMMDLKPWQYWSANGEPAEGTEEIMRTLESVMRRNPDHLGANHFYVHTVEASPHPEWGLPSADRLRTLAPGAGHLVHMPSHIYARLGDHAQSAAINDKAAAVDRAYIQKYRIGGVYPMMYYNHNMHFAAYSHAARGHYAEAMRAARQLVAHAKPQVREMPMIEMFTCTDLVTQVRFRRWPEILRAAEPPAHLPFTRAIWRFGRGMAYASRAKADSAATELEALSQLRAGLPKDLMVGFSSAGAVIGVAEELLRARIAGARGDAAAEIQSLERAVTAEDALPYNEPPDWYLHARESLGGALLRAGRATQAEAVFRADLERNPRNARSLFGLAESLMAQGKAEAARAVGVELQAVWKGADTQLTLAEL
jgi:tetratricopeptide (TPR) repeat protein